MHEAQPTTVKERYVAGARRLVTGEFPISFDELPEVTDMMSETTFEDQTNQEACRKFFVSDDDPFEKLAWWAYEAFAGETREDDSLKDADFFRYFSPDGAGAAGFMELSRHIANVMNVYRGHIDQAHYDEMSIAERKAEFVQIALNSFETIRFLSSGRQQAATNVEKNLSMLPVQEQHLKEMYESAIHNFSLQDVDGKTVAAARDLEGQYEASERSYMEDMRRFGKAPERRIGCFALKIEASSGDSALFQIWHGMVLATVKHPELFESRLHELDYRLETGRIRPALAPVQ